MEKFTIPKLNLGEPKTFLDFLDVMKLAIDASIDKNEKFVMSKFKDMHKIYDYHVSPLKTLNLISITGTAQNPKYEWIAGDPSIEMAISYIEEVRNNLRKTNSIRRQGDDLTNVVTEEHSPSLDILQKTKPTFTTDDHMSILHLMQLVKTLIDEGIYHEERFIKENSVPKTYLICMQANDLYKIDFKENKTTVKWTGIKPNIETAKRLCKKIDAMTYREHKDVSELAKLRENETPNTHLVVPKNNSETKHIPVVSKSTVSEEKTSYEYDIKNHCHSIAVKFFKEHHGIPTKDQEDKLLKTVTENIQLEFYYMMRDRKLI
jgi:hypothetical protein